MPNCFGILIGPTSFVVIGLFHPVVIKCEYYFSERIWPLFLAGGLAFCAASLFAEHLLLSAVLGVVGFTLLWSIHELKQQAKRVEKGWFPKNPKRAPKN
ncbi:DUF4491 family protein [Synergistes jonesii]|uniref:Membrane protein n=1 Tax=Synergistes jonesii TaxID=2754 RepID=A0A073IRE1_9BACT|nr:DUF4491 family protein [Synergistes jonesii]KEJ92354.1 membrane protein [Synergistes jonesii]OFB62798.1 membrane protein [Synergistes jonesii]OFB63505.1 membrane protein [Synergistes jonesii]OFB65452.1 membrane protein [Synergistes jonesii]OFB67743.1 membrane protein [Synergistes jonesii]